MKRKMMLAAVAMAVCVTAIPFPAAAEEEVTLDWFSDVLGWGPDNWTGVDSSPLLDALKENYGVSFTIEQPATDASTKLALMIATNDLPDLISITDEETISQLIESRHIRIPIC